ncbi:hypothetical protein [Comamonas badia]|jgi:hypothetical protein|nr:hypothetical protein [Comamonas badia]
MAGFLGFMAQVDVRTRDRDERMAGSGTAGGDTVGGNCPRRQA